jgi:hypothetical protein
MVFGLASCEALWLRKILLVLFKQELEAIVIHCNNQIFIKISKNMVFHDHRNHINIRYHFIRDCV